MLDVFEAIQSIESCFQNLKYSFFSRFPGVELKEPIISIINYVVFVDLVEVIDFHHHKVNVPDPSGRTPPKIVLFLKLENSLFVEIVFFSFRPQLKVLTKGELVSVFIADLPISIKGSV